MPYPVAAARGKIPPGGVPPYYVNATGGNDANHGRSPYAAWQTIAKVNASTFQPGDKILFKRGETWSTTQLLITQSGSAGRHITFDAYGSGALPIIQSPVGAVYKAIYVTGNYVTVKNIHALTQEHQTNLAYGIRVASHDVTIDGCIVEGNKTLGSPFNNAYGIIAAGAGTTCYNIIIKNCEVYNCGWTAGTHGISLYNDTYPGPTNVQILDNIVHDIGGIAYSFQQFGIYSLRADNVTCSGNLVYNTDSDGIQIEYTTNSVFEKNAIHHAGLRGIGHFLSSAGSNVIIKNNLVYLCRSAGILLGSATYQEGYVYHNTLINNATSVAGQYGFAVVSGVTGAVVKNNLILQDYAVVGDNHNAFWIENDAVLEGAGNIFNYNCCIYLNHPTVDRAYRRGGAEYTLANWRLKGILMHPELQGISADPILASSIHTTVNADSAAGQKVLNVTSTVGFNIGETITIDPIGARMEYGIIDTIQAGVSLTLLVNLTYTHTATQADVVMSCVWTDFHLQSTSPCIAAGDPTVGVLTDYDGVVRGAAVDIGAYEYVA